MFEYHLEPFREAIRRGTAAMMPYYGMPVGLERNGVPIEEVGFGYNRQIVTDLLRGELGFDGVVVTDWELVNDNHVGDQVLPARAWGVEELSPSERMLKILDAGADQFGGEECVDLLIELVRAGASARAHRRVRASHPAREVPAGPVRRPVRRPRRGGAHRRRAQFRAEGSARRRVR
jgi:beta-glucosidase